MKTIYKIVIIGFLVFLLVLIRFLEEKLFYDPFITFFRSEYQQGKLPDLNFIKLLLNLSFRFWLNTVISLIILYVAFLDKNIFKFATLLYIILFLFGGTAFTILALNLEDINYLPLFYVRRFLIHPVFVLILLPAFYYYQLQTRSRNIESFS